ncbi:MAG TPA: hypothetical protein VGI81_18370 [Tepidisphaeraceae bacterium]|jgi:hypothetical protein
MATHRHPSPEVSRYCEGRGFSSLVCRGGFDYLLESWTRTVAAVEGGYWLSFDEYLNDMDSRNIIDELPTYASDDEWAGVETMLPPLDARFHAATRQVDACIWGECNEEKYGYRPDRQWWYYRAPADMSRVADRDRWAARGYGT